MLSYLTDILGRKPMDYAGQRAMLASANSRARMSLAKNAETDRIVREHHLVNTKKPLSSEPIELVALNARKSPRAKSSTSYNLFWGAVSLGLIGLAYLFARYLGIL